jgi:glucose-1-phosphate thymidylyltransferase
LKAIVLAAGYARRLYPLTQNQAKSHLPVAGRLMIERVLDSLTPIPDLRSIHIVTNDKFHPDFCQWLDAYRPSNGDSDIRIINNGSREGNFEIGAVGNLHLVLDQEMIDEDIIVVASDNLFSQSLEDFVGFSRSKNSPVVAF